MKTRLIQLLAVVAMTFATGHRALAAQESAAQEPTVPIIDADDDTTPATLAAPPPGWWERDTLTGDWGGGRSRLQEHGIRLRPQLTQFHQGLGSGDGIHGYEYGGKFGLLLNADAARLGMWDGLSFTVHAEYNFGETANGRGGTLLPVNTALLFPGLDGADAFDFTSVFLTQRVGNSAALMFGKINMIDLAAGNPFMGGAGIDAFQNIAFVAPPSGIIPPYLFGGILSIRTKPANYTFMVFDPVSAVNRSGLEEPFSDGVTFRASVAIPVTIAGRSGNQGFNVAYSTQPGTDLAGVGDVIYPPPGGGTVDIKDNRYYVAYSFDQYLYQSKDDPRAGFGLFGQVAVSDGNPNPLDWNVILGVGGTARRSQDKWGVGFFHYSISSDLRRSLAPVVVIDDEQGVEIFYNAAVTPWLHLAADLQIIDPILSNRDTAIFFGLRAGIRF